MKMASYYHSQKNLHLHKKTHIKSWENFTKFMKEHVKFYFEDVLDDMGHAMQKLVFGHMRTVKAQISLCICAV